ncbi:MAG TPA: hypothetical protein VFU31_19495 [Candidatus Binatia bacterium]|nr:hypothetical protein [Candidatus Binatia bacterium]
MLWQEGPWDLPGPSQVKPAEIGQKPPLGVKSQPPIGTETIVSKNLFDPERGAGMTREVEASSKSFQRIRGMVLLGTAIIGGSRVAVVQDGGNPPAAATAAGQGGGPMRFKLGDTVEGFTLAEIADRKIVFTKGPARVEVALDYFRKLDVRQPTAATPAPARPAAAIPPRAVPSVPRRLTRPAEPAANPSSEAREN